MSHDHHAPSRGEQRFVGPTEVTDPRTIEEICRFRAFVWSRTGALADRAFHGNRWRDEFDLTSRHWIITRAGEMVAAARLSLHDRLEAAPEAEEYLLAGLRLPGPIASPGRVVVAPSAERRGLASRLIDVQDRAAVEAGTAHAVRQASPDMSRLLTRRGWREIAASRVDSRFPGVTFRVMHRAYGGVP